MGVTKSEIESYLSGYNITNVVCEEVKPKYDTYKSFKIGVCVEVFETVLDPEFWDDGVLVKKPEERIVHFSTTTLADECIVSFGFECLFLNIQGLRNKTFVFEDFLKHLSGKSSLVLICISEHWLNLDELALHVPSGYQMASAFCRKNHIRGGSAIFIRVNIEFRIIDVSDLCRELIIEVAIIALDVSKLIVVSRYHPPGTDPGRATMDAIETLVCQVVYVFENRLFAQATLCDLSKAFDTVCHNDLLLKLEYYGITHMDLL
ncbi:hypothetical protein J6590_039236 [Homalodisca vitripennis]|nr:hypothetical protein J6590_039236 [Homalodisca vitripennis]